jgi:large conductance mechanosensitive channel
MARVKGVVNEFKGFVLRGNVLDLAVAVIIGAAFATVVSAFTDGVLMAIVAAIVGEPNFDRVILRLGDGEILVGSFLTAAVNFLLVAAALFVVLKAASRMKPAKPKPEEEAPAPSDEALLLAEIRDLLRAR